MCGLYFHDHLILNLKHIWNHCGHSRHNNVDIYLVKSIILSKEMILAVSAFGILTKFWKNIQFATQRLKLIEGTLLDKVKSYFSLGK